MKKKLKCINNSSANGLLVGKVYDLEKEDRIFYYVIMECGGIGGFDKSRFVEAPQPNLVIVNGVETEIPSNVLKQVMELVKPEPKLMPICVHTHDVAAITIREAVKISYPDVALSFLKVRNSGKYRGLGLFLGYMNDKLKWEVIDDGCATQILVPKGIKH